MKIRNFQIKISQRRTLSFVISKKFQVWEEVTKQRASDDNAKVVEIKYFKYFLNREQFKLYIEKTYGDYMSRIKSKLSF